MVSLSEHTSQATGKNIAVLDYTDSKINIKNYSSDDPQPEIVCLHKFYRSHKKIVETLRGQLLVSKVADGKCVMSDKDVADLDGMIGLACIAMNECRETNKNLWARNADLRAKCVDYDRVAKKCDRFKCKLDTVLLNLRSALGRGADDKDDVLHLINVAAALFARENENRYVRTENDKLEDALNERLINVRSITLSSYDEMLNVVDGFAGELAIKDLEISRLTDRLSSAETKNERKAGAIKSLQELFSKSSRESADENGVLVRDELSEGTKPSTAGRIGRPDGTGVGGVDDRRSAVDLIGAFERSSLAQKRRTVEELALRSTGQKTDGRATEQDEERSVLRHRVGSAEAEARGLKEKVETLECALNKKNTIIKDLLAKPIGRNRFSPTQFNNLLHTLSKLEEQMDITLDDLNTCKKRLVGYETVLNDLQSTIQQQSVTRNNWIAKNANLKDVGNKNPTEIVVEGKTDVSKTDNLENKSELGKMMGLKCRTF